MHTPGLQKSTLKFFAGKWGRNPLPTVKMNLYH